jgi:CRISPR type III-A-associated protein Csm2
MSELEPQETPGNDTPGAETPGAETPVVTPEAVVAAPAPDEVRETAPAEAATPVAEEKPAAKPPEPRSAKPNDRGPRPDRRERQAAPAGGAANAKTEQRGPDRGPERGPRPDRGPDRGGDRRGPRGPERGGDRGRGPELSAEIDLDKLVSDSLYLDNQAHAVVARLRDMDSGTRSQLRRFFSAVRRAYRAAEGERQHQFVMLRARLAYTIARHQLRSLDPLERLLLQVTRKNDAKGYERFRDLFEAIVAYNE